MVIRLFYTLLPPSLHPFFRRILYACLSLFFGATAVAQTQSVKTYYDDEKQVIKESYMVKGKNPAYLDGPYISYYPNGNPKASGHYKRNEPIGEWKYYYENGNVMMAGDIKNKKRQGEWQFYFEDGKLKSKGFYIVDRKNGLWTYYNEDGTLKGKANFTDDRGIYREFYDSTTVKMEGLIVDGKSDSTWRYYYPSGQLKAEGPEKDGIKTGYWKYYYPDGILMSEGNYQNGQSDSVWHYYHENGTLSARGIEKDGKKEGTWKLYYPSGDLKGEGDFANDEGPYKEYFKSGELKAEGHIKNGKKQGHWKYYSEEDGTLEGEADLHEGEGIYKGYYTDGSLKMQGTIQDDIRVGVWKLYKPTGELAGYYQAFYENNEALFRALADEPTRVDSTNKSPGYPYQKPPLRLQRKKSRYFTPKVNEFKAIIVSINPIAPAFGSLPLSVEHYIRERIGYELKYTHYRMPFFKANEDIGLNKLYKRGFSIDLRQKFYQPDTETGMLYFAHEIRFSHLTHYANILDAQAIKTFGAKETLYEYSVLLGNRWMPNPNHRGITLDLFAGLGIGYRSYTQPWKNKPNVDAIYNDVRKNKVAVPIRIGFSIGYAF